jgi:hypothetical protein
MKKIVLGISIWGEHYQKMFLDFCLPSLMAPGNLPALAKEREIILHIYTTAECMEAINLNLPFFLKRKFTEIETPLGDKYAHLGAMQRNQLQFAHDSGADYHLLMPDYVYSENCFTGILSANALGRKAIARLVMSTKMEGIVPKLTRYRIGTTIAVPHANLATLALSNIHPACRNWLAQTNDYPSTHVQVFVARNNMRMLSPHQSPVFVAHEAITVPTSMMPLDSQLDKITSAKWYCPKEDDGICMIEITPATARTPDYKRVGIKEFCRVFKFGSPSKTQWELFNEETVDPINRYMLPSESRFWRDSSIIEAKRIINQELLK